MESVDCAAAYRTVRGQVVENAPCQIRAKRAGLSQKELAVLMGVAPNTISHQLRGRWASGVPHYLQAFIVAWEMLTQAQKDALREQMRRAREEKGE